MRIRLVNLLMSYAEDAAKNDETSQAQRLCDAIGNT